MRWTLLAACAAILATLWLPGEAAEPASSAAPSVAASVKGVADKISFEQYREWRLAFNERRRGEIAVQLAAADLPAPRKTRLEQVKAYYDWLSGLSEADRDRRFRERFDRIDINHDGQIEASERAAWRDKREAFYRRDGTSRRPDETAVR